MKYEHILEAVSFLKGSGIDQPDLGLILGTGLDKLAEIMHKEVEISYTDIPYFVETTVEAHKGSLLFGTHHGKKIVMMRGRFHLYEGYSFDQITFPVRVLKVLGIKQLLVSNASGALNPSYSLSDLVLLDDHINFLPGNPLTGRNIHELGPRFPDLSQPYDPVMNKQLKQLAETLDIALFEGVYAAWAGPSLETRAEYRFLRNAGADVVGMSTVPEVIVANHMKLPVAVVSVVTDLCDPDNLQPLTIEQVLQHANKGSRKLSQLFDKYIQTVPEL